MLVQFAADTTIEYLRGRFPDAEVVDDGVFTATWPEAWCEKLERNGFFETVIVTETRDIEIQAEMP